MLPVSPPKDDGQTSAKKRRKVSQACDFCKCRKAKCSFDQPCKACVLKGRVCSYQANYTRGTPRAPPSSLDIYQQEHSLENRSASQKDNVSLSRDTQCPYETNTHSPSSPELGMAEIEGQVFDPTSSLTFLHRAWRRLSAQDRSLVAIEFIASAAYQKIFMAEDKPLVIKGYADVVPLPSPEEARELLTLYFDICIDTYRILHRPSVETWV